MYTLLEHSPHSYDSLAALIAQAQQRHILFPQPAAQRQPVVVAVSGGVDSVSLLDILVQFSTAWKLDLHVAHVDHALRPTAAQDVALVRSLAEQVNLPFHTIRLDAAALHADRVGLEAAARRARYRFLCATAVNVTPDGMVPVIAVAHHAGDQAETVLLRLAQGSGLAGLAAMRPVTSIDDPALAPSPVRLVRPLLAASRAMIVEYASRHNLVWCEDESNLDELRSRNLIRHQVLPLLARINPQIVDTLARTAGLIADESERLRTIDEQAMQQTVAIRDETRILLTLSRLQQMAPAALRGVLYTALARLGAETRDIGASQLTALAAAVLQADRRSGPHSLSENLVWSIVTLPGDMLALALHRQNTLPMPPPGPWLDERWQQQGEVVVPKEGTISLGRWILECKTIAREKLPSNWRHNVDRWTAFFDADTFSDAVAAVARPGLKIDPLGLEGKHKQVGDIFTDAKIAPSLRRGWPVLLDRTDGRVLWVCGLAQSHSTRITDKTRRVWLVQWRIDAIHEASILQNGYTEEH